MRGKISDVEKEYLEKLEREAGGLDRKGDVETEDEAMRTGFDGEPIAQTFIYEAEDEAVGNTLALEAEIREPTWVSIFDAPRDGHAVTVRFADPEIGPRWARWKISRKFLHRRWIQGGSWINADSFVPLPAEPTEYLKLPEAEPAAIPESGA